MDEIDHLLLVLTQQLTSECSLVLCGGPSSGLSTEMDPVEHAQSGLERLYRSPSSWFLSRLGSD